MDAGTKQKRVQNNVMRQDCQNTRPVPPHGGKPVRVEAQLPAY